MSKSLEFIFNGNKGKTVRFAIRNITEKTVKYSYSCSIFDGEDQEVMSRSPDYTYDQNRVQTIEPKGMISLAVEVSRELSDKMVFVCNLDELDPKTNRTISSNKYSYRANINWSEKI